MITKTYGINHLVDWAVQIPMGKGKLNIHFENGATTKQGVTPAEYTTDNKIFQMVIEKSAYYQNGTIFLLCQFGEEETAETSAEEAELAPVAEDATTIEASCREDVVEYMKQKFGYTSVQLRTKSALTQALEDHNINVVGVEL